MREASLIENGQKKCSICKQLKEITTGFHKDARTITGYASACRVCRKRYTDRQHRPVNRVSGLPTDNAALRRYGLTLEDWKHLRTRTECEICAAPFVGAPHIDHSHDTGKVRGLLCTRCNVGLGMFRDNPKFLQAAVNYLSKDT